MSEHEHSARASPHPHPTQKRNNEHPHKTGDVTITEPRTRGLCRVTLKCGIAYYNSNHLAESSIKDTFEQDQSILTDWYCFSMQWAINKKNQILQM